MQLTLSELSAGQIRLSLGNWQVTAKRRAGSQTFALDLSDGLDLELEGLALEKLEARHGVRLIEIARLSGHMKIARTDGKLIVLARNVVAENLRYQDAEHSACCTRLTLSKGLSIREDRISIPELVADGLEARSTLPHQQHALGVEALTAIGLAYVEGAFSGERLRLEAPAVTHSHFQGSAQRMDLRAASYGRRGDAAAGEIQLDAVEAKIGDGTLSNRRLLLEDARLGKQQRGLTMKKLRGASLCYQQGDRSLQLADYLAKAGLDLSFKPQRLALPHLAFEGLVVAGLIPRHIMARASMTEEPSVDSKERWQLLDGLRGNLATDVYMRGTYPVYGPREATHLLRIALAGGALDFRQLEQSLSLLEDMVVDLELTPDALILEKDVPLIPFDNQTLIRWPLQAEEHTLAEEGRIRLSTLMGYELVVANDQTAPGELALHRLELRRLSAIFDLEQGGEAQLGPLRLSVRSSDAAELPLAGLTIEGAIHHDESADVLGRTILAIGLERVELALELLLADRRIALDGATLEGLDPLRTQLTLDGFTPDALALALTKGELKGVSLEARRS